MAATPDKLLALDANVLFDLAAEKDFAHQFREAFLTRGYGLLIPPTAVQELVHSVELGRGTRAQLAEKALKSMLNWGIKPFDFVGVGHGITQQFYERLVKKGMLPIEEKHDGFILAETALRCVPVLVTCDKHLLSMDVNLLRSQFEDADLFPVATLHPGTCWRAIRDC
jgi:hypothetical protein